ncbi:hypothetical protein [Dactylosporangium sp. NPDC048998]|uniref:hypothetical protein n=1 Tax=Dactylosporangium sp. NPDC048998 TaxID=3363976 RepID=UPI00371C48D5
MDEDPTCEQLEDRRRSAAIRAFIWLGLEGPPDPGLIVKRLGNARFAVRSLRGRPDDALQVWLREETHSGALRENAACLAVIEERESLRAWATAEYLRRHPSRALQLADLAAVLAA